jgi:hypothetical protein
MNMNDVLFGNTGDKLDEIAELRAMIMRSNQIILDYIDADTEEKSNLRKGAEALRDMVAVNTRAIEMIEDSNRDG